MPNYLQTFHKKSKPTPIFHVSLLHEFAGVALGVFFVLLAITLITQVIRLLGQAASGALAAEGVLALLGFKALNSLPVLLSLTLFISVLLTLTRSYRDSEMIVWFCSGESLASWIRPVTWFALPLVFTIALLSLTLSPWANLKGEQFRLRLDSRDDVSKVASGVFQESKQADRVYFVEDIAGEQNRVANIFVQSMQHQRVGTMVAREGYQELDRNGDRFLVLLNGTRYEGKAGSPEYKVMSFERYALRVEAYEAKHEPPSTKSISTLELLRDRTPLNLAELGWRIGLPVSALILAWLAIPLSFVNPRAGRSLNLILAILIYMIYNNFLSVAKVWVAQGKIGALSGLLGVHTGMIVLLALLFYRRLSVVPPLRFWR